MQTSEISELNLGRGINARDSENQIGPGFWETLVNAVSDGNTVKKRKGYQQLGGYLPFRVQSIEWDNGKICFTLDDYVNLSRLRSSPLVVKGTTYGTPVQPVSPAPDTFDFHDGIFSEQYYNQFDVTIRRTGTLTATPNTYSFEVEQAAHGHNSWIQHSNVYRSTSQSNLSNELIYPDLHQIDATTNLNAGTGLDKTIIQYVTDPTTQNDISFIHASIDASELGTENYYPNTGSPNFYPVEEQKTTNPLVMSFDVSLTELQSSNLLISVYRRTFGGAANIAEKIIPDNITINGTQVDITIDNAAPDPQDFYFYVATAVPDTNVIAGQVTPGVQDVTISGVSPFTSYAIYTVTGGVREYVFPDTAIYDDTTGELTITFDTNEAVNYQIYYKEENLRVNEFCVDENNVSGSTGSTSAVELDVYGIDPLEVMEEENRNHWLTHIDNYRSEGESELVTGVAGVSYRLAATTLPTMYPRYEQVLDYAQYLCPYFQNPGVTFPSTPNGRGFIACAGGFSGPEVTNIAYQSGTGYVRFTLSISDLSFSNIPIGTGPSEYTQVGDIYTSVLENDQLTVEDAGYSVMNGSHDIKLITIDDSGTDPIVYVDCDVEGVTNSDYDETEVGGYAQIYTSPLTIQDSVDDLANTIGPGSTITVGGNNYTVRGNSFAGNSIEKLYISDVTGNVQLSSGLFILGTNNSYVHPMRTSSATSVDEYVKGDMVQYTGLDRWIKIKDIIQLPSEYVSLAGSTLTMTTSGAALNFQAGQKILLLTEGLEGGVVTVNSVSSEDTLELSNSYTATSARLIGKTFEIDESLEVSDTVDNSLGFTPTGRWDAIQKPSVPDSFDVADKVTQYPFNAFATTQQDFIRSTMVADNMYLTNGEDTILKYDGTNISRAGLFRWEGALFVRKVLSTGGDIVYSPATETGTAMTVGSKTLTNVNAGSFTVGQSVILTPTPLETTVSSVDLTNQVITIEDRATAAHDTITSASVLKYYFRLNMIDANDNIIGSAASGVDNNYTIQMIGDTTVGIKLAKPPKLPLLDYDRLEYEVYRTKQDGAIFYKVATLQITHDNSNDYIYFKDTVADSELTEPDLVSTSTVGAEIATGIDEPLRAKYITSANNRLVLGNLKTSPRVDVRILRGDEATTLNGLTFNFANDTSSINYKFNSAINDTITGISAAGVLTFGTLPGTQFSSGTWVYLFKTANSDNSPEALGWFKATGPNTIPYNGPVDTLTDVSIIIGSSTNIPIYTGVEFSDDNSAYQSGSNQLLIPSKLLNAIHGTQFKLDGFSLAGEGRTDSSELGRFAIKSLDNVPFTMKISDTGSSDLFTKTSIFVNNNKAISGTANSSKETTYASRMLVSFQNFPELFDKPRAIIPEDSLSVIDVNSADGQEITGIIPFFGESTSQDSQKQDVVICFKENSIYAINIRTRQITKIDSRGVGCNAPRSITAVPNGIIFAARSGIYRLNRAFDVIWVGRYLDRVWKENTNLENLELAAGHVYPTEQQYRLSVAVGSGETASETYTYEYGDEQAGQVGAWNKFNNIPSTGWASNGVNSFFGSTKGRMYQIRNTNTDSDFRDDEAPVAFEGVYRGMDFGAPGRRKIVRAIVSHFRVLKEDSGTVMDVGVDLTNEFTPTSSFKLIDSIEDGLSTIISSKVKSIRQNIASQKGIYFQVRYTNSTIDTPMELCGITYHVAGLDYRGITQAVETV